MAVSSIDFYLFFFSFVWKESLEMYNKLQVIFIRFYIAILVGFVLFFVYSIYSFIIQLNLHRSIENFQKLNNKLTAELEFQNAICDISNKYIRTKIDEFNLTDLSNRNYSSEMIKNSQIGIILLIIGDCGICFENEIPIWNYMFERLSNTGLFMVAINLSVNKESIKKIYSERSLNFPILQGNDTFTRYKTTHTLAEIITFIVKPDLTIEKINVSIYGHPEKTKEFVNQIIENYGYDKKVL